MKKDGTWLLSTGHFLNDFYCNFLPILLPIIMPQLGISLTVSLCVASPPVLPAL